MRNVMQIIGMATLGFMLLILVVSFLAGGVKEKTSNQAYLENGFQGHSDE